MSGDFDEDGKTDIASSSDPLDIWTGDGKGGLTLKGSYVAENSSNSIAEGDFNGDLHLDLVRANFAKSDVTVFVGKGDGTFEAGVNYAAGVAPEAVAIADFNGDGHPDLAVADRMHNTDPGHLLLFLNDGKGAFGEPKAFTVGTFPRMLSAGDLNGDGRPDVAVATNDGLQVLFNGGGGEFSSPIAVKTAMLFWSVRMVDLNGDGRLDLLTAIYYGGGAVFLNKGDGTFEAPLFYETDGNSYFAAAADFDGDGKLDIAVNDRDQQAVTVLKGKGDGSFVKSNKFPTGGDTIGVIAADLNSDGAPDVITGNATSVSVLMNQTQAGFAVALSGPTVNAGDPQTITVYPKKTLIGAPSVHLQGSCVPAVDLAAAQDVSAGTYSAVYPAPDIASGCSISVQVSGESADHQTSEYRSQFALIPCPKRIVGDVTGNGERSVLDAVQLLQLIAGIASPDSECEEIAADVNCDGSEDVADAVSLMKSLVFEEPIPACSG